jgi:hypothetical protein
MAKKDVDVIDDPDIVLDEIGSDFEMSAPEMDASMATTSEMSDGEVEEARAAIAASKDSADRLITASRELESLVFGVIQDEGNSLAGTEVDIADAKNFLNQHSLKKARKSVKKAEESLATLEEDVLYLRRNIAMLHRLLTEKKVNESEVETILIRLRSATGAAEIGDVSVAAEEVEHLVDDLIGGNTSTLIRSFSDISGLAWIHVGQLAVTKAFLSSGSSMMGPSLCRTCAYLLQFQTVGPAFLLQLICQSSLLGVTSLSALKSKPIDAMAPMKSPSLVNLRFRPHTKCELARLPQLFEHKTARWNPYKTLFCLRGSPPALQHLKFPSSIDSHQTKSLLFACLCALKSVQEATPEPLQFHPTWGIKKQKMVKKYERKYERKQR